MAFDWISSLWRFATSSWPEWRVTCVFWPRVRTSLRWATMCTWSWTPPRAGATWTGCTLTRKWRLRLQLNIILKCLNCFRKWEPGWPLQSLWSSRWLVTQGYLSSSQYKLWSEKRASQQAWILRKIIQEKVETLWKNPNFESRVDKSVVCLNTFCFISTL